MGRAYLWLRRRKSKHVSHHFTLSVVMVVPLSRCLSTESKRSIETHCMCCKMAETGYTFRRCRRVLVIIEFYEQQDVCSSMLNDIHKTGQKCCVEFRCLFAEVIATRWMKTHCYHRRWQTLVPSPFHADPVIFQLLTSVTWHTMQVAEVPRYIHWSTIYWTN